MSTSCYGEYVCTPNQYVFGNKSSDSITIDTTQPYIQQSSQNKNIVIQYRKHLYMTQETKK